MTALNSNQLYWLARYAGLVDSRARIAAAIALAESGGNSDAHNGNAATGDDSYGLWQINMIGAMGPARRVEFNGTNVGGWTKLYPLDDVHAGNVLAVPREHQHVW